MFTIEKISINHATSDVVVGGKDLLITFVPNVNSNNVTFSSVTFEIKGDHGILKKAIYHGKRHLYYLLSIDDIKPFSSYELKVSATISTGEKASATLPFSSSRLSSPWHAKWISDSTYSFPEKVSPSPMTFRKNLVLAKKVKRAFISSTALGIYELVLNGKKVGKDYFAPGFTSYRHQMQYQTYEVTSLLRQNNTLFAIVGGGWAVGSFTYGRKSHISGDRQALLLELYLEYEDGSSDCVGTDESWDVTEKGNYRFGDWYDGETYDATIDLGSISWQHATYEKLRFKPHLLAQYGAPVRVEKKIRPIAVTLAPSGETIYDFGQNFAGVIQAKIHAKKGQTIVFRHAEVLIKGELFVKSLRTAKATATYIAKEGDQEYSPRLTYMGFRYVGVKGIAMKDIELSALVLHSDFDQIGSFECSNPLLNRLQKNIVWSGLSNFMDIPTDCPQRDERQGWTGDAAVFAPTACFNFDLSRFYSKWLLDMKSEQSHGGGIPMVVPKQGDVWPAFATSCWGDSCILVPYAEYRSQGDVSLLKRQYPVMKKFLKAAKFWSGFLSIGPNHRLIWRYPFHFGDWCAPNENIKGWMGKGPWVGTAYFANSAHIVSRIASVLGCSKDAARYDKLSHKIAHAYHVVFTDKNGTLKKEFQTGYVLPLSFNLVEGREAEKMADNLDRLVKENGNRLSTGFTGTPYLLFALSDHGHLDTAYNLLLQDKCPSWLYEVKAGATTIWERWDALREDGTVNISDVGAKANDESADNSSDGGMVSFNHYANGAVGDWLYRRVLGLEAVLPAYEKFRVSPLIGGGLTYAKGGTETPYGTIHVSWKIVQSRFSISVQVPIGTECQLILPSGVEKTLFSGHHTVVEPYSSKAK